MVEEAGPRQRAAETKRLRTREALVTAAIDLVSEAGKFYRVEDIAGAAGISLATLYNHFGTKKELIDAAYARLMSPVTAPILSAQEAGAYNPPDRRQEVERFIRDVATLACAHRALTVELVRAWMEHNLGGFQHDPMVPSLAVALKAIIVGDEAWASRLPDFPGAGVTTAAATSWYHLHALLISACQSQAEGVSLANSILFQLMPSLTFDRS